MDRRIGLCLVLVAFQAHAQTEKNLSSQQQVVVHGGQADAEAGRDNIAGRIVVGKQRIAESGVQNVGELLRREPAISIGKDGRLGLLGLPGYTQILVDGTTPVGDALGLDLVHVERIEIVKSSTAATGPFGIAGTINIVRRKAERKAFTQASAGAGASGGRAGASLSWLNNQVAADSPFVYNLALSARRSTAPAASSYVETRALPGRAPVPEFTGESRSSSVFQMLSASSELSWTPSPAHKIVFAPDAGRVGTPGEGSERRHWADGRDLMLRQDSSATLDTMSLPLRWHWQLDTDSTLGLRLAVNGQRIDRDAPSREEGEGIPVRLRRHHLRKTGRNQFLDLDYNIELKGGHEISAGTKLIRNRQRQDDDDTIDGQPDLSLAALGTASVARMDSARLFLQDEWRIDRSLSLNAGLAVERRLYRLDEGPLQNRADFDMWSPSLHLSRKLGGDRKRQLRFSLARSFQPPETEQLLLHPTINRFAPCQPGRLCDANGIDSADGSGNPALRPERALALNLSYTHGIGSGSEVQAEWYARAIQDKTGYEYALVAVPWASVPRYVVRPVNLGRASVRGVNLEGRVAGKDIATGLAALELHGSLGFARSELGDVPGPDNRIAGQLPWRVKFGGSYTLKAPALKLGLEASLLPADWMRDGLRQRTYQSSRTTLGLNGSWKIDAKSRLSLNLENLLHKDTSRIEEIQSGTALLRLSTSSASHARIGVKFDTSL